MQHESLATCIPPPPSSAKNAKDMLERLRDTSGPVTIVSGPGGWDIGPGCWGTVGVLLS